MAETDTEPTYKPSVTVEDVGPARKCLTIEIPPERIAAKIEEGFKTLNNEANIPGFRRGHVPRKLIERRFAAGIRDDARAQLISEAYGLVIEDQKLEVMGEPDVKDHDQIKLPEEGPMVFKVEIEVSPEVTLPAFDSLEVKKTRVRVTDEDLESEIERLRERYGKMTSEGLTQVQEKDYVLADVHVLAGENAADGSEELAHHHNTYVLVNGPAENYKGHVAGIVVEELGKKLAGRKVGDEVLIPMTGPSSHENEKIKDQPITLKLNLRQIERMEPAPLETLKTQMGFETVEALRDRVRQWAQERREREQRSNLHQQVCDQLIEKVDLTLPEGLTGRQTARVLQRQAMELAYIGMSEEQIQQKIAEARNESEEEARRQLKLFFILDKAAKDLDIEVTESEINGRIAMMAMQQGRRPERLRQQLQRSGEIENLFMSIREQKALDRILEKATVTEVDPAASAEDDQDKTA